MSTFQNAEDQDIQTNNFSLVLYEFEMWSLTLRENIN